MIRRWVLVLVAFGALGCAAESGQTGSALCPDRAVLPGSCPCDNLGAGVLVRVQVVKDDGAHVEADVVETFVADGIWDYDLVAGEHVGGSALTGGPCDPAARVAFAVGDEVLVAFNPGGADGGAVDYPNCQEKQACLATNCASLADSAIAACDADCVSKTHDVCSSHRTAALLDGTFRWAIPWASILAFEPGMTLPASEISVLNDHSECVTRFPPAPVSADEPCSDVVGYPVSGCSISRAQDTDSPVCVASASWALLGLAWLVRRRRGGSLA